MYEVLPLNDSPARADIIEKLIRKVCLFDTVFSDFKETCQDKCFENKEMSELCPLCFLRMQVVSVALSTGLTWEVWKTQEEPELVGIIRLSDIRPGSDATGHYIFFDNDLRGKTEVIRRVIKWAFQDHDEGWQALRRITITVPDFAFALVRHATRKLGFGGEFSYRLKGKVVPVEGVKRKAIMWRGDARDVLQLGLMNSAKQVSE